MKLKHKILYIIIIVVLLVVAGVFYFYSRKLKYQPDLIKYMPHQAVFFAEYDLGNKNLIEFLKNNRQRIYLEKVLIKSKFFGDLKKSLLDQLDKMALIVVNDQGEYEKIWIIQSKNIHRLAALAPKNYFMSNLNSNTIAIAKKRSLFKLIKVRDVLDEKFLKHKLVLNKFSSNNFLNIYFSADYLKHLSKNSNLIYHLILSNLGISNSQPAFLGIKIKDNQVQYNFFGKSLLNNNSKSFSADFQKELLKLNFNKNGFFNFVSADLKNTLNELEKILTPKNIQALETKYEFKWKDLQALLNSPGFIFTTSHTNLITKTKIFDLNNYDYLIAIKTNNNSKKQLNQIKQIKKIIKNILAYKYPSYKTKKLPDSTPMTEIIADPSIFSFKKYKTIDYIEFSAVNFAIASKGDYLLIANNKDFLQKFIDFSLLEEKGLECVSNAKNEIVILNTHKIYQSFLQYLNQIIINIDKNKKDLELSGCFNF